MNGILSLAVRAATDPIVAEPALPTGWLIAIAAAGLAVLLVLIIAFRVHAFIALLVVSILVALSTNIPLASIFTLINGGAGATMTKVMIIIALGAVLGRIIEVSGGVQSLADRFTSLLGPKRVAVALTMVAFLVAIPVFFEVAVIVMVPIIYAFAKIAGVSPVKYGLPMFGLMLVVHVVVPPHPGIVAGAGSFSADVGLVTLVALPICVVLGFLCYWISSIMNRREYALAPAIAGQIDELGSASNIITTTNRAGVTLAPPGAGLIITLIAIPIVQILVGTVFTLTLAEGSLGSDIAKFVAAPVFALLVAVIVAYFALPIRRGWGLARTNEVFETALPPIASILLVVAGGGIFGAVLTASGIGTALKDVFAGMGVPIILLGFLLTLILRAALGSATVAIVATGGLLASTVAAGGYSPLQVALITVAVGFGGLGLSMVTDAGFWIVVRYLGLTVADGLRTWTVLTTILSLAGFIITWLVFLATGGGL